MKQIYISIIFLFLLLLVNRFVAKINKKETSIVKGKKGENKIKKILKDIDGVILSNLYFIYPNYSTEIDILFINECGVFVIESKNYKGKIHGNWEDKMWKQFINGEMWELINPIYQNNIHVKEVEKVLNSVRIDVPVWSVIVFSNEVDLEVIPRRSDNVIICKQEGIVQLFNYCRMSSDIRVTDEGILKLKKIFKPYTKVSKRKRKKHIKYVSAKTIL